MIKLKFCITTIFFLTLSLLIASCSILQPFQPTLTPTVTPTITPTPYPLEIVKKGARMLLIPSVSFMMGSDNGDIDEKPVHRVSLDLFYMDQYEVTNALYKTCVDSNGCTPPSQTKSSTRPSYYGNAEFDDYPVIYVNFHQAMAYCKWRGVRLPSEAEWEYAARGTDGRTYPWGDDIDHSHANFFADDTIAVGSLEPGRSPFGLYDMAGNVWEWVDTLYTAYPGGDPKAKSDFALNFQVIRGGAWDGDRTMMRSSYRNRAPSGRSFYLNGFRCAFTP